ncbi:MAG: OmpH family outer membrane protein [Holosporaceae bacterium]|jgi:Skp family chaperone for outer membrane proteins|nr:OmpH family outer membrane protein [Holosporaceae bacterium]
MRIFTLVLLLLIHQTSQGTTRIAVVDLKRIATESKAGKSIEAQIEAINNEARKELEAHEARIKAMDTGGKTGEDVRKIEELQIALYDMVRTRKYRITEAYRKAMSTLETKMKEVIKEICIKKGLKVVLNAEMVVLMFGVEDITEEVISRLNKVLPNLEVEKQ